MINKKIINIRKSLDKLDNQLLRLIKKRTSLVNEIVKNKKFKEWFSEHLYFNQNFENLEIETSWVVDAPIEHVMFKSLKLNKKFMYFLKTFKEDIKSLLRKRL